MVDAKAELKVPQSTEQSKGTPPFSYDSMRFLIRVASKNWFEKHEQGRSLREITEIIDKPNETPEKKAEAADIRHIKLSVLPKLLVQNEEEYPQDKLFPLQELTDAELTWIIMNVPDEIHTPSIMQVKKEAQRRELKPKLDDALNNELPRDLFDKLTYQKTPRRSMVR